MASLVLSCAHNQPSSVATSPSLQLLFLPRKNCRRDECLCLCCLCVKKKTHATMANEDLLSWANNNKTHQNTHSLTHSHSFKTMIRHKKGPRQVQFRRVVEHADINTGCNSSCKDSLPPSSRSSSRTLLLHHTYTDKTLDLAHVPSSACPVLSVNMRSIPQCHLFRVTSCICCFLGQRKGASTLFLQ